MHSSLGGLPKRTQTFLFFSINSVTSFLGKVQQKDGDFKKLITSAQQVKKARDEIEKNKGSSKDLPISGVNIAFTKKGLIRVCASCSVYFQPGTSLNFYICS